MFIISRGVLSCPADDLLVNELEIKIISCGVVSSMANEFSKYPFKYERQLTSVF